MDPALMDAPAPATPPVATHEQPADDYNFEHFRTRHLLDDLAGTLAGRGIRPGAAAPDFELPRASGGRQRLGALRDRPVLLHFGSFT
jgi:hypothetical protein